MDSERREKLLHRLFLASVIAKGLNGLLQLFLSFIIFTTGTVSSLVVFLTHKELLEDPSDRIANFLAHLFQSLSTSTQYFVATYLLIHGLIHISIAVALLRRKLIAYPIAILVSGGFLIYQLYRFTHTHSLTLIAFSILDVLVITLTWHEYNFHKERLRK